jgi:uncharacterized protein (TIGR02421 family)
MVMEPKTAARDGPVRAAFERRGPYRTAGDGVELVIDGSRPFLVIVRDAGASDPLARLVSGEAAVLRAGPEADPERVRGLVRRVAEAGAEEHGSFLLVEVWAGERYRVLGPAGPAPATVESFARGLEALASPTGEMAAVVEAGEERSPPDRPPLLSVSECHELGVLLVGLELAPSWRDAETGDIYPVYLRRLAHRFSDVLRAGVFEFVKVQAAAELSSYRALGRRTLGDAVWDADRRLAEIDASFDPLLLVAPVNTDAAWERFRDRGYRQGPDFRYRLLPIDPDLLKRELYEIRLEEVDDPAAWRLLRDKREELDKQISLVSERNTAEFLHSSIRLFGPVDAALRDRALEILDEVPPPTGSRVRERVDAATFAELAHAEFDHYRQLYPSFESAVQIRPDLVGLMVSSGRLLIGEGLSLDPARVEALLQHEVGTHVLTFVNGSAQPFRQLAHGFADYDELQEGLGVLAEYLVGGLNAARMRLLAARVIAVDACIDGASFVDTFRRLHDDHGFTAGTAFSIAARVYASAGFTRDIIYLRGLLQVVEYLRDGGPLEPLYVGKIAARHIETIRELEERKVLRPVPLLPRFFERDEVRRRLEALRDGLPLHAMIASA